MPPPTTLLGADSGYASRSAQSDMESSVITDIRRSAARSSVVHEDDAASTYSDDSIMTSQENALVQNFSEQFVRDLTSRDFKAEWLDNPFDDFEHMLADFSLRLGQEDTTIAARGVVKFVHKNRR